VGEARSRVLPADLAAAGAVVVGVLLVSYWRVVNAETFMRLAIGRMTAAQGLFVAHDPWIYSVPGLGWRNPEWLGDLLLYGVYRAGGEAGLVGFKLLALSVGWSLLYLLGRRAGGRPLVLAGLILLALAGSEGRFMERNELHLYWLLPAYGLALQAAVTDRRWLLALLPLGWLWASLHGSFPVGWLLVGAALAESMVGPRRDGRRARALALALALHPLLPFLSPDGLHAYDLLIDHYRHGEAIKATIKEWVPPNLLPATLAGLPLHLLGLIALGSFLPRPNRTQVQGFVLVAVGLLAAHGALRFFLVFAMLAIPTVAANLQRAGAALPVERARWRLVAALALALGSTALVAQAARAARLPRRAAERADYPVRAGRWLAAHAPPQSRLFGPYTGSQMLMWEAPAVGLYIHPHFSFGSELLLRYVYELLPRPEQFEAEVRRLDVNLALVGLRDESGQLAVHLAASPDWRRVYGDGLYAIFARNVPRNRALLGATE
jgi:hypothetical protein